MAYLGKCYLCEKENVHRMPVYIKGRVRLVCHKHGATTSALFDAMNSELTKRVRIHKNKKGFTISRMHQGVYGGYQTNLNGRQEYRKWETVLAEAKKFID